MPPVAPVMMATLFGVSLMLRPLGGLAASFSIALSTVERTGSRGKARAPESTRLPIEPRATPCRCGSSALPRGPARLLRRRGEGTDVAGAGTDEAAGAALLGDVGQPA